MTLKKLKPGMEVYVRESNTRLERAAGMGMYTWESFHIADVDAENELVLASGHGGERWYHKNEWSKWRLNRPE